MINIVGNKFKTKYNDELLVLEQLPKEKGKNILYRCQFQKYPCEVFREKSQILNGSCINPLQEEKEFIGKIFKQNGDFLKVIDKSKKSGYYFCEFQKYFYKGEFSKQSIKKGNILNPQIEQEEFINKIWPQNCGDSLRIIEKSEQKQNNGYLYKCEFINYPFEIYVLKSFILKGTVFNPRIEEEEFINKIWPQNCGDSLRIIKKTDNQVESGSFLFEAEFIKYPYKILAKKETIKDGNILNAEIEKVEFVNKIWPQNCGDSVKIEECNKYKIWKNGKKTRLYKYTFIKYPYCGYGQKSSIKSGTIDNHNLPYKTKEGILDIFVKEFPDKKPTLKELSEKLNISITYTGQKIQEFNLKDKIKFSAESTQELDLRNYARQLNDSFLENSTWLELDGKEIDIYSADLNLGIEFNGNYWDSELFKNQNYHQEKSLLAKEKGIKLIHIWEWEWNYKQEILQFLIKAKLGIFDKIVYARNCIIKELKAQEYQPFCEKNHLQGKCGAKVKLGLFYKNELIQIMSFGSRRLTDKFDWEIIRECSKLGYCIVGGKERLWKYFIKKYNPKNCISYCDFSKFNGNSYLKLGFKKERLNKPGFVWWDNDLNQVFWRNAFEHQKMKKKYYKLWDCGQLVFEWHSLSFFNKF